mmetsp:Transcript_24202/g.66259  ORF Transcript_24202/g.66259 Transcript_24202/m.66259 type:complete len:207 (-) Transcript_24202:711-1331(-)
MSSLSLSFVAMPFIVGTQCNRLPVHPTSWSTSCNHTLRRRNSLWDSSSSSSRLRFCRGIASSFLLILLQPLRRLPVGSGCGVNATGVMACFPLACPSLLVCFILPVLLLFLPLLQHTWAAHGICFVEAACTNPSRQGHSRGSSRGRPHRGGPLVLRAAPKVTAACSGGGLLVLRASPKVSTARSSEGRPPTLCAMPQMTTACSAKG